METIEKYLVPYLTRHVDNTLARYLILILWLITIDVVLADTVSFALTGQTAAKTSAAVSHVVVLPPNPSGASVGYCKVIRLLSSPIFIQIRPTTGKMPATYHRLYWK
jgi:hypothetical protein